MSARLFAVKIVARVAFEGISLDQALNLNTKQALSKPLSDVDFAFAKALSTGTIQRFFSLSAIANRLLTGRGLKSKDHDIFCTLLVGLYQLIWLDTPSHAAVFETVKVCKALQKTSASSLVNACLRRFLREKTSLEVKILSLPSAQFDHPDWLIKAIQGVWPQQAKEIFAYNNLKPTTCLRVNRTQVERDLFLQQLSDHGFSVEPCAYSGEGVILNDTISVKSLPGYGQGFFYIQDQSAQLAADLLSLEEGSRVLDLCAAPGGKLTHCLEKQPLLDEIVAVDKSKARLNRIKENLHRLNYPRPLQQKITVRQADASETAAWWDGKLFDRILLDAPCSGTGVIRRHPDIKLLKKEHDIQSLLQTQHRLLQKAWPLLKPGGLMLYVTCSILPVENELMIERILGQLDDCLHQPIIAPWGISRPLGRQILPNKKLDGFYYALLKKTQMNSLPLSITEKKSCLGKAKKYRRSLLHSKHPVEKSVNKYFNNVLIKSCSLMSQKHPLFFTRKSKGNPQRKRQITK